MFTTPLFSTRFVDMVERHCHTNKSVSYQKKFDVCSNGFVRSTVLYHVAKSLIGLFKRVMRETCVLFTTQSLKLLAWIFQNIQMGIIQKRIRNVFSKNKSYLVDEYQVKRKKIVVINTYMKSIIHAKRIDPIVNFVIQ